jgi:hypothetical protein
MITDHAGIKLGKKAKRHDARTLRLSQYLSGAEQAQPLGTPASADYTHGITDWGLMLNDQLGCCTIAAIGHAVQAWTVNALGRELTVPDSTILSYYEQWDGYDPANPASDQGGVELDVLNAWRQNKFAGHALEAYVSIALGDPGAVDATTNPQPATTNQGLTATSLPQIATAIWLFGGAYIGLELPITAQKQDVWDLPAELGPDDEPGSWGGHAVYVAAYDATDSRKAVESKQQECGGAAAVSPVSGLPSAVSLTCITWGKPKKMTLRWFEKYCSEAYALVSTDWLESSGIAPSGFDLAALEKDLAMVTDANCRQPAA